MSLREGAGNYECSHLMEKHIEELVDEMSDAEIIYRQQVAEECRALANRLELEAVTLIRKERRRGRGRVRR
jgi:phosphoribosylpyrophosphate synthetase